MITHHAVKGLVWLDAVSPDDQEISDLTKRYGLHPLTGEKLKSPSAASEVEFHPDYILVILTLPVRSRRKDTKEYEVSDRKVDFVIGKNFLITSRFDAIEEIEYFAKIFETNSIINKEERIDHPGHLFYHMVKRVYERMVQDLENIGDALKSAEDKLFDGTERQMVDALSELSRELIDFAQATRAHGDIWLSFISAGSHPSFGKELTAYIGDLNSRHRSVAELVANSRELLEDLRRANDSLLSARQSKTVGFLAALVLISAPLLIVSSLFSIPAAKVPIVGNDAGWYIVCIIMLLSGGALWWYSKQKRWI